nr:IS6 family transposase [Escherichia coli]
MNPFKGRHFQRDIILWAVRWYCKYGISYRELQEMLAERGVNVDHSTIYRWVQRYAPEMEKRLRWYWRNPSDLCPWHMDETYVKVNGRWAYLYRAVDSRGRTVDFYLSSRRNSKAAYRFLGKILNNVKKWQIPRFINTDKAPAYGRALALLKREGRCPSDVEHRQIKYRNGTVAKLAMRQPFVLFKGLTFQKLCLPGAFRPGDHHNKMLRPGLCVVHASPQYL